MKAMLKNMRGLEALGIRPDSGLILSTLSPTRSLSAPTDAGCVIVRRLGPAPRSAHGPKLRCPLAGAPAECPRGRAAGDCGRALVGGSLAVARGGR